VYFNWNTRYKTQILCAIALNIEPMLYFRSYLPPRSEMQTPYSTSIVYILSSYFFYFQDRRIVLRELFLCHIIFLHVGIIVSRFSMSHHISTWNITLTHPDSNRRFNMGVIVIANYFFQWEATSLSTVRRS
jgi:hypothetical protein